MRLQALASLLLVVSPTRTAVPFELPVAAARVLDGGRWDDTPSAFRVIALSQLADACAEQGQRPERRAAAVACLDKIERAARRLQNPEVASEGLFLTHYALILGAQDRVAGCVDQKRHARLAARLAAMSLEDPTAHAPSYPTTSLRWPADQSATLAALHRFDLAHGGHTVDMPLSRWRAVIATHLDARGLPWSEVTGHGPGATVARGCAQSYLSRYLAEVDPALSHRWWVAYRAHFLIRPGPFVGFREWPEGVLTGADVDSGPIIMGVGAAASAFGIAAARAQGDGLLAEELEVGADLVLSTGAGGPAAHSVLAEAIRVEARWQPTLVR
jgi:hypothetical protein